MGQQGLAAAVAHAVSHPAAAALQLDCGPISPMSMRSASYLHCPYLSLRLCNLALLCGLTAWSLLVCAQVHLRLDTSLEQDKLPVQAYISRNLGLGECGTPGGPSSKVTGPGAAPVATAAVCVCWAIADAASFGKKRVSGPV